MAAARALHDVARLGDPQAAASRLAELAASTDAPESRCSQPTRRRSPRTMGRVGRCRGELRRLGLHALGSRGLAGAASAFHRSGRAASARTARAHTGALLARCEGAQTPALTAATVGEVLTRREREVALLAARGITNREIAQRLVVSVRTIESHLAQSYRKLGVSDRSQLGRMLTLEPTGRNEPSQT